MSVLRTALDEIYRILCGVDNDFANIFNAGLTRAEIETITHQSELYPTEELYELYQWRNGIQFGESFFPAYWFSPLSESLDTREMLREIDGYTNRFWKLGWLPIFICDDNYYFVDCGDSPMRSSNVYFYTLDSGIDAEVAFPNLTNMVEGIAECYRDRVYTLERFDHPDVPYVLRTSNEADEDRVFAKYSPESELWKPRPRYNFRD